MDLTKKRLTVALIGCGFIGEALAKAIDTDIGNMIELITVYDEKNDQALRLSESLSSRPVIAENADDIFANAGIDLVIEAASQKAVKSYLLKALASGKSMMILSVGALDDRLLMEATSLAREMNVKVYVPSGAVAALDWIKAASRAGLEKVAITTKKPPQSFEGSPYVVENRIDLRSIDKPTQIYEGPASEACSFFPANVNVATALGLAGIGNQKTMVRVVADPTVRQNVHEITAEGIAGKITVRIENVPAPANSKTSLVASLSAIQKLKEIVEPLSLG